MTEEAELILVNGVLLYSVICSGGLCQVEIDLRYFFGVLSGVWSSALAFQINELVEDLHSFFIPPLLLLRQYLMKLLSVYLISLGSRGMEKTVGTVYV